jgi:hypothetical protein
MTLLSSCRGTYSKVLLTQKIGPKGAKYERSGQPRAWYRIIRLIIWLKEKAEHKDADFNGFRCKRTIRLEIEYRFCSDFVPTNDN